MRRETSCLIHSFKKRLQFSAGCLVPLLLGTLKKQIICDGYEPIDFVLTIWPLSRTHGLLIESRDVLLCLFAGDWPAYTNNSPEERWGSPVVEVVVRHADELGSNFYTSTL